MKNKHKHITEDSIMLKQIRQEVNKRLMMERSISPLLWSKFIFYFLLVALSYMLIYFLSNPYLYVLDVVLYGMLSVLLAFNFAHDFSHHTIFRNARLDNLCFTAIYTLVGAHAEAWKHRHVHSHHFAPNVEGYDTDLKISGLIRLVPGSRYKWYHRYQHWYAPLAYTTYSLFWVFIKDVVVLFSEKNSLKYHLSFWVQKSVYISYLLVFPLLFSRQGWQTVLVAFLLMHMCQSLFLLFTFFITHHVEETAYPDLDSEGMINASWLMNQVKSSNDFYPFSEPANFIFGGFNNHIAHHLFPSVHHVHYPWLSSILYDVLGRYGVYPNRTTYMGGVRSHLRLLKKMGRPDNSTHLKPTGISRTQIIGMVGMNTNNH